MDSRWKRWLIGLLNAAISGAVSGGVGLGLGIGVKKSLAILGASALASLYKWLAQNPLPGADGPQGPIHN